MVSMTQIVQGSWGQPDKVGAPQGKVKAWYRCRLHEDRHPSFAVYEDGAKCFQCGAYFGPVSFLVKFRSWPRLDALAYVAGDRFPYAKPKRRGIIVKMPPQPPAEVWQEAVGYLLEKSITALGASDSPHPGRLELESRGISPQVTNEYRIGWNEKWVKIEIPSLNMVAQYASGLVIPVWYKEQYWSINVRTTTGRPKYLRVAGGNPRVPFGMGQLKFREKLVVVEGELDMLTAAAAVGEGADVLALRGVNDSLEQWSHICGSYKEGYICMNGDEPGQVAAEELQRLYPFWTNCCPPVWADDLGKMVKQGMDLDYIRSFLLEGEQPLGL